MPTPILQLKNLVFGHGSRALGEPLNLELKAGEALGIIGGNGRGKSTLLKTLLGLLPPLSGSYHWEAAEPFGYVPQESEIDELFPFTVQDVLKMGKFPHLPRFFSKSLGLKKEIDAVLESLELGSISMALFRELSGGQKQRVLIGRALMGEPKVLILDEPFNSLDYAFRAKLWRLLQRLQSERGLSVVVIEHDLNRIINEMNQVILLGEHRSFAGARSELIQADILTQIYESPLHVHEEASGLQIHFL